MLLVFFAPLQNNSTLINDFLLIAVARDSHLVYAKPMQKSKIYTDRFRYHFGTGFYLEEASGAHKWHWSDKKSELIIENKAKENIVVHSRFTFSSKQEINTKIVIYKDIVCYYGQ
ncbi:MAG: hypothetical protein KAG26_01485 [Methylococcales bacterium]|nr:hypothetical protein [Methylococcales bacterium]